MTSTLAPDGDGVKIHSFLIIITQSDTKNTEYLIRCLQKTTAQLSGTATLIQPRDF